MGPTRLRDLAVAVPVAAVFAWLVLAGAYGGSFPAITLPTGVPLLVLAVAAALWGRRVRTAVAGARVGIGAGRLHPLLVARTLVAAKASAWLGALATGWWTGASVYLLGRRAEFAVAAADTPGALVATACAAALTTAGLWLQHCCVSPGDPPEAADRPR